MRREFGSFSGNEASPQLNDTWRIGEEDFPQEVIAVTEDGLAETSLAPNPLRDAGRFHPNFGSQAGFLTND